MQVLTANCPYCQHEVDSTIEKLDGPIICPACHKPFEMEIPTAAVTSVHQVDERSIDKDRMAVGSQERVLVKVHPVVFRARPIASLVGIAVSLAALSLLTMSLSGVSLWGYSFSETIQIGPASLLTLLCAITLLVIACTIGYWILLILTLLGWNRGSCMQSGSLLGGLANQNDTVNIGRLTASDWALSECLDKANTIRNCRTEVYLSFNSRTFKGPCL
jgi:hypothetical protein